MRLMLPILLTCCAATSAAPVAKPTPAKPTKKTAPAKTAPAKAAPAPPIIVAAPPPLKLTLPLLSSVPVQLELNGTEGDVLGMLKSFARGLEAANANGTQSAGTLMTLLNDGQISAALKDIHRLHLVVYDLNPLRDAQSQAENQNLLANLGDSMLTPEKPLAKIPAPPIIPDAIAFYEPIFNREGGQRLLMADFNNTRVLMSGFDAPQGFALVVTSPSRVIVARADGYPDLEVIGRMIHFGGQSQPPDIAQSAP